MSKIHPPIILDETGATDVFNSIASALSYVELIDVMEDRYLAFDSQGRLLRFRTLDECITLELAEVLPSQIDNVRKILVKFLRCCGSTEPDLDQLPLEILVSKTSPFHTR